jgi:uncharacterized protein (DUF1330 family)
MPRGYIIVTYRKVKDPDKLAAYAKLAGPAVAASGGKLLVRGLPAETHELGLKERPVVMEFADVAAASAQYHSAAYQEALRVLSDGAERDIRICEGVA